MKLKQGKGRTWKKWRKKKKKEKRKNIAKQFCLFLQVVCYFK